MTDPITINGRPMRVCWGCNSPLVVSGYGTQTALITPRMRDRLGVDVTVSASYGHYGRKITWNGIDIYPSGFEPFGNDIHAANAKQVGADILLTHQDVWTQDPRKITAGGVRWVSWQPLDSEPVAPAVEARLKEYCYQPLALSRFGQAQAALAGIDTRLILQGIDTGIFVPGDKRAARARLGWPESAFIVGMVAQNRGYPNRKAYPQNLEAFGQLFQQHRDAMIYIHAYGGPEVDSEASPLMWHLDRYGAGQSVIWAKPYDLNQGYAVSEMVTRYQAIDVLLLVSMSEGFGIPLIEAQACGIPVVTGDWTAMAENCYAGWKVAREDSDPWPVSPLECFWRLPRIGAIQEKLEAAYAGAHLVDSDALHRMIVAHHDQDMLIDTQWRPVLEGLAARIGAERIPHHTHRWSGWGHQTEAGVVQVCEVEGCVAERREGVVAQGGFPLVIDGITLDIEDGPVGGVKHAIASEILSAYRLQDLTFAPGDVIVDIGAHVGIVACYLAKKWPETTIYAIEPIEENYVRLMRNIDANGCANVHCINVAVTADGRTLTLTGDPDTNTGHYSAFAEEGPVAEHAPSMALPDFLSAHAISRIALLKLDCEGAEYEILYGTAGALRMVDRLVMEVHENRALTDGRALVAFAQAHIPFVRASIIRIPDPPEESAVLSCAPFLTA